MMRAGRRFVALILAVPMLSVPETRDDPLLTA
jgi:hypothetical protein